MAQNKITFGAFDKPSHRSDDTECAIYCNGVMVGWIMKTMIMTYESCMVSGDIYHVGDYTVELCDRKDTFTVELQYDNFNTQDVKLAADSLNWQGALKVARDWARAELRHATAAQFDFVSWEDQLQQMNR